MADVKLPAELTDAPEWADEADRALSWEEYPAPGFPGQVKAAWEITDLGSADWAMRRLAVLEQAEAEDKQQHKVWQAQIDGWRAERQLQRERRLVFFRSLLTQWALAQREKDPRGAATIKLPSGEIATTMYKEPTVVAADDHELLDWARDHWPQAVKVSESLLISELRKVVHAKDQDLVVDDNGERVPGVAVVPPHITAKIKPHLA